MGLMWGCHYSMNFTNGDLETWWFPGQFRKPPTKGCWCASARRICLNLSSSSQVLHSSEVARSRGRAVPLFRPFARHAHRRRSGLSSYSWPWMLHQVCLQPQSTIWGQGLLTSGTWESHKRFIVRLHQVCKPMQTPNHQIVREHVVSSLATKKNDMWSLMLLQEKHTRLKGQEMILLILTIVRWSNAWEGRKKKQPTSSWCKNWLWKLYESPLSSLKKSCNWIHSLYKLNSSKKNKTTISNKVKLNNI